MGAGSGTSHLPSLTSSARFDSPSSFNSNTSGGTLSTSCLSVACPCGNQKECDTVACRPRSVMRTSLLTLRSGRYGCQATPTASGQELGFQVRLLYTSAWPFSQKGSGRFGAVSSRLSGSVTETTAPRLSLSLT